ncbi:MAG: cysteine hydrolase [Clostridia bacterium]|nr:cysteine hydrolase [Clostridia bacterium]
MSEKSALLIVDVQMAPLVWHQYGGPELYKSEELISNIEALIEKARASSTPVIYIQYTELGDSYRAEGQPMWEIPPQIKPQQGDLRILKYHADPFYNTTLQEQLTAMGINQLVIVGVQTEFCVDTTCRTAFSLGYKNILVSDGHSTFDSNIMKAPQIIEHHNGIIGGLFAELKKADEVVF